MYTRDAACCWRIGFRFEGADSSDVMQTPDLGSALLAKGNGRWSNVMTGTAAGLKARLFDCSRSVARSQRGCYKQTVAPFSPDLQLRTFEVCPDSVSDPIRGARSYLDMDFGLSQRSILRGPNQDSRSGLIQPFPDLRSHFMHSRGSLAYRRSRQHARLLLRRRRRARQGIARFSATDFLKRENILRFCAGSRKRKHNARTAS